MSPRGPLAIDLFCGLGGWTEGLLAEGYWVVGFDLERHRYPARLVPEGEGTKARVAGVDFGVSSIGLPTKMRSFNYANEVAHRECPLTGGWIEYPAQLVIQDVLTIHGSQFKDAALIVASPPCQEYSYMAMPWTRAKRLQADYESGVRDVKQLTALFDACFRIQREAIEAAGHFIPLVVENVRGANRWVGRSRWNFGSFHLWGDVPALMPIINKRSAFKGGDRNIGRANGEHKWNTEFSAEGVTVPTMGDGHTKNTGGSWFNIGSPGQKETGQNTVHRELSAGWLHKHYGDTEKAALGKEGVKQGGDWFNAEQPSISRQTGSKSNARKAASAMIAKIPLVLSRHIAAAWHPRNA